VAKRGHDRRDLSHDAYPPGELAQELPTPRHFEQASSLVTEEMMAVPCGSDPEEHLESIRQYGEEERAHRVAWSVVENKYEKNAQGNWVQKND
jgi:hypothetical protein